MHKLKKGLKKKIKGKDHKDKGEDLFDPEQLAKYKKELEAQRELEAQQQSGENNGEPVAVHSKEGHSSTVVDQDDEEWQRFNLLTAGVDSILKKTSGDLNRIKESSYFQRNKPGPSPSPINSEVKHTPQRPAPPPAGFHPQELHQQQLQQPHVNRWVDCDNSIGFGEDEEVEQEEESVVEVVKEVPEEETAPIEEPEEEPIVLADELFDTSFVDAIASGEIKLAYIPDSPTEPEGDDPFDTSSADAVVKVIEEEAKKERKRVNLGLAVTVLTAGGNSDSDNKSEINKTKKRSRNRPHNINLLGSFDSEGITEQLDQSSQSIVETQESQVHDIFDELSPTKELPNPDEFAQVVAQLIQPVHLTPSPQPPNESYPVSSVGVGASSSLKDILSEFESFGVPNESTVTKVAGLSLTEDPDAFLDDEFSDLAAESFHKSDKNQVSPVKGKSGPPKRPAAPTNEAVKNIIQLYTGETIANESEEKPEDNEPDPFDTSYVEAVGGLEIEGKTPDDHIIFEADTNDLIEIKQAESVTILHYEDAFDTSTVDNLKPGKFELKFLEEEFLASTTPDPVKSAIQIPILEDDDFDFDPRKDEKPAAVEPELHPLDTVTDYNSSHVKALTPQVEVEEEIDPFDTSAISISAVLPGRIELKILEDEFGAVPETRNETQTEARKQTHENVKDFDFDPRHGEPEPPPPTLIVIHKTIEDIFDSEIDFGTHNVLTPSAAGFRDSQIPAQVQQFYDTEDSDPFDTSSVAVEDLICGKSDLRHLEAQLLHSTTDVQPPVRPPLPVKGKSTIVKATPPQPEPPKSVGFELESHEHEFLEGQITPLKPLSPTQLLFTETQGGNYSAEFVDPFDTSIASSVVPGKIEIQLLESELGVQAGLKRTYSDRDFDPIGTVHPSIGLTYLPLLPQTVADLPRTETSSCDLDDPFDTSVVDNIVLAKSEIKQLEAELL